LLHERPSRFVAIDKFGEGAHCILEG
jgi:hypothetical protein